MHQKTGFSVVGNDVKNVAFVPENEGSDLGMPRPDGPPSSDCPVGWHADDAPRRHRVRDRSLPKTRECVWPFPQGLFMPPKTQPKFFRSQKHKFCKENLGSACPHSAGAFYAPKNTPQGFSVAENTDFVRKTYGRAYPHSRRGFLCPQKHAPRCFPQPKCCFG